MEELIKVGSLRATKKGYDIIDGVMYICLKYWIAVNAVNTVKKNGNVEKKEKDIKNREDFNFLSDWSTHYHSWKNINFCPIKIIKYEDCLIDVQKVFVSTLDFLSKFLKFKFDNKKINNALTSTSFKNLSRMEKNEGFQESATSYKTMKKIKFFNLGKKNNWETLLDKKLIRKIESRFKNEMSELGYL